MANSRVGVKISVFTLVLWVGSWAIIGSPNAAVLPVPVWAWAIRSCFEFSIWGIVSDWIGVGVLKPIDSRWVLNSQERPNDRNVDAVLLIVLPLL